MQPSINQYSSDWFNFFLREVSEEQTARELAFLSRQFPPKTTLLDFCCGEGRHSAPLADLGYDVTGIDASEEAIRRAEKRQSKANFVLGDIRNYHLPKVQGAFCLWQSFGYFTSLENRRLLGELRAAIEPGGRLVLDVYNRDFFAGKDGVRSVGGITESKRLKGRRLEVHLAYPNGKQDRFDWELYNLQELETAGADVGLTLIMSCTTFDERVRVSEREPRMQLVFKA